MKVKKEQNRIPADKLALYVELMKTNPNIKRKGVRLPYTSFNSQWKHRDYYERICNGAGELWRNTKELKKNSI